MGKKTIRYAVNNHNSLGPVIWVPCSSLLGFVQQAPDIPFSLLAHLMTRVITEKKTSVQVLEANLFEGSFILVFSLSLSLSLSLSHVSIPASTLDDSVHDSFSQFLLFLFYFF